LSSELQDHVLSLRHVYVRNPILASLNLLRSKAFHAIRVWFEQHDFVDVSAPLITPSLLYEPNSAIHLKNLRNDHPLYLSQCAGFYLEASAHAHERVYNLGPSFRNESRTNRHLMEYWHIKAELCSGTMEDIMQMVEIFLRDIYRDIREHVGTVRSALRGEPDFAITVPFRRMSYRDAIEALQKAGFPIQFGCNIGKLHEDWLTKHVDEQPLWITHKPRSLEPFPYCSHKDDKDLSMTADLIAPHGFGEICGVAEKSFTAQQLEERIQEKGKTLSQEYMWVRELRDFGMVPHTAFGMGYERLLRWMCGNAHVKDNIPFPRIFGRHPLP
jgi:asparaginyl-tRNA synthetase